MSGSVSFAATRSAVVKAVSSSVLTASSTAVGGMLGEAVVKFQVVVSEIPAKELPVESSKAVASI